MIFDFWSTTGFGRPSLCLRILILGFYLYYKSKKIGKDKSSKLLFYIFFFLKLNTVSHLLSSNIFFPIQVIGCNFRSLCLVSRQIIFQTLLQKFKRGEQATILYPHNNTTKYKQNIRPRNILTFFCFTLKLLI